MPIAIQEQYHTLQMATYMGIFPEISRVWVTVDNRLYLWDYENPSSVVFPYEALDNVIIAVALCTPRPGLFLDRVKYILVISTAVEIVILALSWEGDDVTNNFRVHQSPYTIPSDDVPMIKIVSAQNGRIFMGGKDGNLYELVYENHGDSWKAKIGIGEQHKCYKINLSSWHLENLVPSVFKGMLGWEQSVQDVAVDSLRGLVYSLTSLGNLYVFYLGLEGVSSQFLSSPVNIFSSSAERTSQSQRSSIVSMHVVSPLEAKGVHLMVLLSSGVRLYFTVFDHFYEPFNPTTTHPSRSPAPREIRLTGSPRHPPNAATLLQQLRSETASAPTEGLAPLAGSALKIRTKAAFYSHGLTLAELQPDMDTGPAQARTSLIGFSQDWSRHSPSSSGFDRRGSPSMREACTLLPLSHPNPLPSIHGDVHDIKEECPQLHNIELSRLRAKYAVSRTADQRPPPVRTSKTSSGLGFGFGLFGSAAVDTHLAADPPPGLAQCIAFAGRAKGSGIALDDKSSIVQLGELVWQHLPAPSSFSAQRRQLLVLTSYGLHRVNKVRPVDYLWRILANTSHAGDVEIAADRFFQAFGYTEACAMCLGIACGLPADVGDGSAVSQQFEEIKRRAMSMLQHFGEALPVRPTAPGTVYRGPVFSPSHDALASFTGRLLRLVWSRHVITSCPSSLLTSSSSSAAAVAAGADIQVMPTRGVFSFRQQRLLFFLNRQDIGFLLQPLILLEGVLLDYFGPAIRISAGQQAGGRGGGGARSGKTNGIIRLITQQQDQQQKSPVADAKAKENASCNGLYLLVCRSIQALKLFQILLRREEENASVKVRWEILKDKQFQDLVVSSTAHDLIRHLLNTVLADLSVQATKADTGASRARLLLIAEQLAAEFTRECNMFFSPGAKHLYEGRKCLANAKSAGAGSQDLADLLSEAGQHLCKAARYWRTLKEVGEDEGVLGEVCDELLSLGGEGPLRAIDICLAAACNFGGQLAGQGAGRGLQIGLESPGAGAQGQGQGPGDVYHNAGVTGADNLLKAKHRCYERIICCLQRVKIGPNLLGAGAVAVPIAELRGQGHTDSSRDVVRDMITYALQQTDDFDFHRQLYEYLLESDKEQLIYVQSRHIEDFLRESDTTLLFRHYKYHSFFSEAAYLMDLQAHSGETTPLSVYSLAKRIEYLEKAVVCTDQAIRTRGSGGQNSSIVIKYNHEKLLSLRDELDLANVQMNVFNTLDAEYSAVKDLAASAEGRRKLDLLKLKIDELGSSLVSSSSDLYNTTHSYHLWNYSLMLLHICKHEDALLVENLWKSIIYRRVPKDNIDIDRYLKDTFGGCFRDKRRERTDLAFEDYRAWIPDLRDEVVDLSQKLGDGGGGGGDSRMFFPVLKLVEFLEQVTAEVSFAQGEEGSGGGGGGGREVVSRNWVHRCLADDVGVRLSELLEAYMGIIRHQVTGKQDKTKLQLYHSAAAIMLEWARLASANSRRHHEDVQSFFLHRVKFRQWLEELQRLLKQSMDAKDWEGKSIYREAQKNLNQAEELMKALLLR
jgi:hypothetical protein